MQSKFSKKLAISEVDGRFSPDMWLDIYDGSDVVAGLDSAICGGHHGAFGDCGGHGTSAKFLQLLVDELDASVLLLAIGNEEVVQLMTASCSA